MNNRISSFSRGHGGDCRHVAIAIACSFAFCIGAVGVLSAGDMPKAGTSCEESLRSRLPDIIARSAAHYRALDAAATPLMKDEKGGLRVPHGILRWKTGKDELDMRSIYWWTTGHFSGSLWYLYEATGDEFFKERATAWTELLAPNSTVTSNHDVGFIMYCSYGNARRILNTDKYDELLKATASSLSTRFNPGLGLIRSWGKVDNESEFLVIPDNMMNLELLEAVSKNMGNGERVTGNGLPAEALAKAGERVTGNGDALKRFDEIARSHADVSMRHHFRADGGCYHVLNYDQRPGFLGAVQEIRRGQGRSCETAWSRGQSWAIYGYTMMYRFTREQRYLEFAQKLADYAINHPNMPEDGIPCWDYGAPGEERDSSAGSIMASALLELSGFVPGEKGAAYRAFAVKQLLSLSSDEYFARQGENGDWLLKHGVGNKARNSEVDTPLDYGDYYFLEALLRFGRLSEVRRAKPSGVSGEEYLELVEAAVAAYPEEHVAEYIEDADRNGVHEHGFPRLAANVAALVSAGRRREMAGQLRRMMDICCRDAKKGLMKKEGNEFSVKELVAAVQDLERAGTFPKEVTDAWRRDLSEVDPWRCYRVKPEIGDLKKSYNWCIFGCASEQLRLSSGMGGDAGFVSRYVVDQMRWFDAKGMWRDPNEPFVYDFVTRLQYAIILSAGYDGPGRAELESQLDLGAEATLAMQSATGEIPYGGRSNQFLHNDTLYAALCEWYASRFIARGDLKSAARFRAAAARAVADLRRWLARRPVRHVKNRYPRSWGRGTGIGCEQYAYFDKYMVTMGSWAVLARRFANETPLPSVEEAATSTFETTEHFHCVFLRAGEYSAQFDYNADRHYDCDGLGRLQRRGAPPQICLSTPCATKPRYSTETPNSSDLAFVPVSESPLKPAGSGSDDSAAWADWTLGDLGWRCRLTAAGLESTLSGPAAVAMSLPAFAFDGENEAAVSCDGKTLSVRYGGWVCRYETDGAIHDTGRTCCNRNGRYRAFEARGEKSLAVRVSIMPAKTPF